MSGQSFFAALRRTFLFGFAWSILGFLVLPMVIVLPVSLTDQPYLSLPQDHLSLRHYTAFFESPLWLASVTQSLIIAIVSTILSLLFGTLCAIGCWRISNQWAAAVRLLILAPLIVPTVIQGLAFYRFWVSIGLYDTYLGVVLAHTLGGLPYVAVTVSASLASFDVRLEQAARSLGASGLTAIRLVILPAVLPGLLSGAVFAFVYSFDELVVVLFITSRSIQTLPKRIWDGLQDRIDPTVASVSVILIAVTLLMLLADQLLRRSRVKKRHGAQVDPLELGLKGELSVPRR
jgi:putative spermidine/putrescine transport system permease protein